MAERSAPLGDAPEPLTPCSVQFYSYKWSVWVTGCLICSVPAQTVTVLLPLSPSTAHLSGRSAKTKVSSEIKRFKMSQALQAHMQPLRIQTQKIIELLIYIYMYTYIYINSAPWTL